MSGLTRAQIDAMTFIESHVDEYAIAPTYEEISAHLELKSKSCAFRLVGRLVDRGYLRRTTRSARGLEILRRVGESPLPQIDARMRAYEATLKQIAKDPAIAPRAEAAAVLARFGVAA